MTQGLPCFLDLAPLCHIMSLRQEGTKSRTAAPSWFSSWRYLGVVAMAEAGRGLPSSKGVSCEAYASVYKPHRYCACSSAWRSATGVAAASFLARAAACCARCCLRLACKQGNGWGGLPHCASRAGWCAFALLQLAAHLETLEACTMGRTDLLGLGWFICVAGKCRVSVSAFARVLSQQHLPAAPAPPPAPPPPSSAAASASASPSSSLLIAVTSWSGTISTSSCSCCCCSCRLRRFQCALLSLPSLPSLSSSAPLPATQSSTRSSSVMRRPWSALV